MSEVHISSSFKVGLTILCFGEEGWRVGYAQGCHGCLDVDRRFAIEQSSEVEGHTMIRHNYQISGGN